MGSVSVVGMEPWLHGGGALGGAVERLQVGPFAQAGLDEAFGFAVGPGRVRPSAPVLDAGGRARFPKGSAGIGRAVVGHDPLDGDAEAGEPGKRPLEEGHGALLALVGQDLGVGEPGGVVDADVEELPADAARPAGAVAGDAVAEALDPAELLDVEVEE